MLFRSNDTATTEIYTSIDTLSLHDALPISRKQKHLPSKDVELAVKHLLDLMSDSLAKGQRIEIRGFGSFSLHYRPPRIGRNPKTGEAVALSGKYVPHFKPGKDLRERVNESRHFPIKS